MEERRRRLGGFAPREFSRTVCRSGVYWTAINGETRRELEDCKSARSQFARGPLHSNRSLLHESSYGSCRDPDVCCDRVCARCSRYERGSWLCMLRIDPGDSDCIVRFEHRLARMGCARRQGPWHGQRGDMDDPCHVYQRDWADNLHLFSTTGKSDSMRTLQQQQASGKRKMPILRQRLGKRPETYLAILGVLLTLTVIDCMRLPEKQLAGRCFSRVVQGYQRWGRPLTSEFIRCRYRPTCSEYSLQAVSRYGLARGLVMTVKRLASCRASVPMGTLDPVK